ncbi:MAG: succinate dehydrogenase, hydrophobic membrane anchor protein [Pseudomonadota bacterium]
MSLRTPLKNVRRLGSAKEGADHFWKQRVTAVANVFLGIGLVWVVAQAVNADHAGAVALISNPFVALLLLLLILSGTLHMRLGMQVVIEDYISSEGAKIALLILNTFFAVTVGLASIYAILKLSFGA